MELTIDKKLSFSRDKTSDSPVNLKKKVNLL